MMPSTCGHHDDSTSRKLLNLHPEKVLRRVEDLLVHFDGASLAAVHRTLIGSPARGSLVPSLDGIIPGNGHLPPDAVAASGEGPIRTPSD
jgi:hypothetical protein